MKRVVTSGGIMLIMSTPRLLKFSQANKIDSIRKGNFEEFTKDVNTTLY